MALQSGQSAPLARSTCPTILESACDGSAAPSLERYFDIIVLGASGSVGKFVVEELALVVDKYYSNSSSDVSRASNLLSTSIGSTSRRLSVPRNPERIVWAVAGRSAVKLTETLCAAEVSTGVKNLSNDVAVLLADLNNRRSLLDICAKTKLIINCAGPYSLETGELVVAACIETRTNYLDLAHESNYIERIRRKYAQEAQRAQVYVINGCGFQSMSAEMGLNFVKQLVDGQIDQVKTILSLSESRARIRPSPGKEQTTCCGFISHTQWTSLIMDKAQSSLPKVDRGAEEEPPKLRRKDTLALVADLVKVKNQCWRLHDVINTLSQALRGLCLPIGSLTCDESQLVRAEMTAYNHRRPDLNPQYSNWKPISCSSYMSVKSYSQLLLLLIWMVLFNLLVRFAPLRAFMVMFPGPFSWGFVASSSSSRKLDRDSLSHIKFSQTFMVYGTPGDDSGDPLERRQANAKRKQDQLLVARVVGPEPNHIATATYCVQAALSLVLERDHLPSGGGVLTPGSAFAETNIIYQLRRRNIKFEVLKKA